MPDRCFDGLESLEPAERRSIVGRWGRRTAGPPLAARREAAVALGDRTALVVEVPMPGYAERRAAWARALRHRRRRRRRREVPPLDRARSPTPRRSPGTPPPLKGATARAEPPRPRRTARVEHAARRACHPARARLRLVPARAARAADGGPALDLVVPSSPRSRTVRVGLRAHRRTNQGLKMLFAGESGTGKTMAAQVLAHDLGLDLYRIDLATSSRSTSGRPRRTSTGSSTRPSGSNAILFFDEADALFGKRSEVARLARPLRQHRGRVPPPEDGVVLRRGHPRDELPAQHRRGVPAPPRLRRSTSPSPSQRTASGSGGWSCPRRLRSRPTSTPAFLASQFKLSGGGIRNASLAAAFLAAEDGGTIMMRAPRQGRRARVRASSDGSPSSRTSSASTN